MGIIAFLRKDVNISRPFLFLLSCFTSVCLGFIITYIYKEKQLREILQLTAERTLEYSKTISEYEKKISDRSKVLEIKYPDGTIKKETLKDVSTQEQGQSVIDYQRLSEKLSIGQFNNMPSFEVILKTDIPLSTTGFDSSRYIGNLGAIFMAYPFDNFGIGFTTNLELGTGFKPSVGIAFSYRW